MTDRVDRERISALTSLAAELAGDSESRWRVALKRAAEAAPVVEIEEVLLQSHLFVGFPVVLNAFMTWRQMQPRVEADPAPNAAGMEARRVAGEQLCARVYGKAYDRLRENVRELSLDLDRWMIEDGYGKTLSRPGLPPDVRELCVVALLAAAGQRRQLRSHLRGALNVGASPESVEAALLVGCQVAREAMGTEAFDATEVLIEWREIRERIGT